jgi:Fe-S-cluster containining protein
MNADIDRPSTWTSYKPSFCVKCTAGCCQLPVEMTLRDLVRMGCLTEDEALESPRKIARKLQSQGIVKDVRVRTMLFTMRQKPNRDCLYLGPDRLCTIYDKRPEVCRRFPSIGPRPGWCPARAKTLATNKTHPNAPEKKLNRPTSS